MANNLQEAQRADWSTTLPQKNLYSENSIKLRVCVQHWETHTWTIIKATSMWANLPNLSSKKCVHKESSSLQCHVLCGQQQGAKQPRRWELLKELLLVQHRWELFHVGLAIMKPNIPIFPESVLLRIFSTGKYQHTLLLLTDIMCGIPWAQSWQHSPPAQQSETAGQPS